MKKDNNALQSKKPNNKVKDWVRFVIVVVLVLGVGYIVFNYVPFVAKYDIFVIRTDSMEPIIMVGDVVVIDTSITANDIEIGDIVAFKADILNNGVKETVVHYINSINVVDGVRTFRTLSEKSIISGNSTIDPWTLTDSDIVGLKVMDIPKIGPFIMFAQSTIGRVFLIADIFIIYILVEVLTDSKKDKKSKSEPEPKKIEETKDTL